MTTATNWAYDALDNDFEALCDNQICPVPDGFTDRWDCTIWNVGFVFRWSEVYSGWLNCEIRVTVKPNMALSDAFEDRMDEPMWPEYAIFFLREG